MLTKLNFLKKITKNVDACVITNKKNIGYLTNFWGTFGFVLVKEKSIQLFTDSRYLEEAKAKVFSGVQVLDYKKLAQAIRQKKIAYEANQVSVLQLKQWKKNFPETSFRILKNEIHNLRKIKSAKEIQKIQKAAQINDQILEKIKTKIKIGITEKELKWEIRKLAHNHGVEKMAFETIVNFGKNTSLPHHEADNTRLEKGDLILIDMGTKFEKYCSDITRVFFTKPPSNEEKKVFEIVLTAQKKAIAEISKNKKCQTADKIARKYIEEKGYGNFFGHSLGHGVGLEIHEFPNLSASSEAFFEENNVFTIEPGIYLPDKFGIRLEDLFIYKEKKAVRLSKYTKKIDELVLQV